MPNVNYVTLLRSLTQVFMGSTDKTSFTSLLRIKCRLALDLSLQNELTMTKRQTIIGQVASMHVFLNPLQSSVRQNSTLVRACPKYKLPTPDGSSVISEARRSNVDGGLCVLCGEDPCRCSSTHRGSKKPVMLAR